jgi:hypothetical protein
MSKKNNNELLIVSLEYGQGFCRMVDMEKKGETATRIFDCTETLGFRFLDYHLHKIKYNLKNNEYIQSIQMIFKNRNNNELKCLIDTDPKNDKKNEFTLEDNVEIKLVRYWLSNDRLTGFEITTDKKKDNVKMIGYAKNDKVGMIEELEDGKKIVFGFGFNANEQYGVSSFYCYYMDKRKYGIVKHSGLFQLRAKLKCNQDFKKKLEEKKKDLTPLQRLILETCDFPDTSFFPIASYVMTY